MAGSPRIVKYNAGRSGVALENTIWCASVVLPHPGAPAMILKENSGRPPPRISSRPGIPVGSLLILTLSVVLKLSSPSRKRGRRRQPPATHPEPCVTLDLHQRK